VLAVCWLAVLAVLAVLAHTAHALVLRGQRGPCALVLRPGSAEAGVAGPSGWGHSYGAFANNFYFL
jgi:hypothetical protein